MLLFYVAISVICCPLCACVFVLAPRLVLGAVYKYLREPLQVFGVFRHVDVELLILMTKVLDIQLLNGIQVSN